MTTFVLISGAIYREPESKTAKSGKPYVVATVRVPEGEKSTYWRITIFSESAQAEMLALRVGDAVSLEGAAKFEIWQPDNGGDPRLNLSMIADVVLPLRRKREKPASEDRRPGTLPPRERPAPRRDSNGLRYYGSDAAEPGLDDALDF